MALWDTPLPPVEPPLSRDLLVSRIGASLADNNVQGISAEDVRSRLIEIIDSVGSLVAENNEEEIELARTAVVFDDPDIDNGSYLKSLFQQAAFDNKRIVCRKRMGDIWVGNIDCYTNAADRLEGHLRLWLNRGMTIRGIPDFEGSVVTLRPTNDWQYDFHAQDLRISAAERPYGAGVSSSTALNLSRFRRVTTYDYWSFGGTQAEESGQFGLQTQGGDSGISQSDCTTSCHINPYFYGFNDLGFYGSADPPSASGSEIPPDTTHIGDPDFDLRRGHVLINPHATHCANAFAFKRLQQNCAIIGGLVEIGSVGLLADGITDVDHGGYFHAPQIVVTGLQGKKLLSRLISVGPEVRMNAANCFMEDWGRNPFDEVISGSVWAAYYLAGASHGQYSNCRAVFREWDGDFLSAGHESRGWHMADYQNPVTGGLLYVSEFNVFSNCMVEGANRAYYEDDVTGAGHNHGEVYAVNCHSPPYVRLQTDSTSHIRDGQLVEFPIDVYLTEADVTISSAYCAPTQYFNATLTSNLDLRFNSNDRTEYGRVIRIVHAGSGAFNVLVYNQVPTLIVTLALGTWVEIQHTTGANWFVVAKGTL